MHRSVSCITRGTWLSLWESCRHSRLRGENMTIPKDNSQLENACKALSVTFGDSSPRGRAKGGRCNCAVCHNSIKKRSASALMRSVNCLTNAAEASAAFFDKGICGLTAASAFAGREIFCYPLSSCSYSSCARRRPTAENDTRAKSSVSRARPRMSSQVTAS